MKFGLRYCNTGRDVDPAEAVQLILAAEEAGFESAWTVEHTVIPENYKSIIHKLEGEIKLEEESLLKEILANVLENYIFNKSK